jgi:hypothetical protein
MKGKHMKLPATRDLRKILKITQVYADAVVWVRAFSGQISREQTEENHIQKPQRNSFSL